MRQPWNHLFEVESCNSFFKSTFVFSQIVKKISVRIILELYHTKIKRFSIIIIFHFNEMSVSRNFCKRRDLIVEKINRTFVQVLSYHNITFRWSRFYYISASPWFGKIRECRLIFLCFLHIFLFLIYFIMRDILLIKYWNWPMKWEESSCSEFLIIIKRNWKIWKI